MDKFSDYRQPVKRLSFREWFLTLSKTKPTPFQIAAYKARTQHRWHPYQDSEPMPPAPQPPPPPTGSSDDDIDIRRVLRHAQQVTFSIRKHLN